MDEEQVNRCECGGRTFEQLKPFACFEAAQAATRCGEECGGCIPYIKLMFATGETAFDVDDPRLSAYE
jgi:NAD(P)H-nitrite reductase large subunit